MLNCKRAGLEAAEWHIVLRLVCIGLQGILNRKRAELRPAEWHFALCLFCTGLGAYSVVDGRELGDITRCGASALQIVFLHFYIDATDEDRIWLVLSISTALMLSFTLVV